ncbi:MAG: GIY-YIG nuclease family protein [Candidatus Omnitrophota bacterium]
MSNGYRQLGYFYILTNKRNNVLYTGSTKDLKKRVKEHQKGHQKGFAQKYCVNRLIYYEILEPIDKAKDRERQVKGWKRERKITLIESKNKDWKDLYDDLLRDPSLRSG